MAEQRLLSVDQRTVTLRARRITVQEYPVEETNAPMTCSLWARLEATALPMAQVRTSNAYSCLVLGLEPYYSALQYSGYFYSLVN